MAKRFCDICNQMLELVLKNGELQKVCKNCSSVYKIQTSDVLLFEKNIEQEQNKTVSDKLLKNVANDNIGMILDKPCEKCKRPFTKLYISEDLETSIILCPCRWEK